MKVGDKVISFNVKGEDGTRFPEFDGIRGTIKERYGKTNYVAWVLEGTGREYGIALAETNLRLQDPQMYIPFPKGHV